MGARGVVPHPRHDMLSRAPPPHTLCSPGSLVPCVPAGRAARRAAVGVVHSPQSDVSLVEVIRSGEELAAAIAAGTREHMWIVCETRDQGGTLMRGALCPPPPPRPPPVSQ